VKVVIRVASIVTLLLSLVIPSGHGSASRGAFDRPLDEYGNLCWEDQKPRLDNLAIVLHSEPTVIGDIIVYDGERACRGEAVAQALRAKKYLVEHRGVDAGRIIWRWGGYRSVLTTTLSVTPRGALPWQLMPSVSPDEGGLCGGAARVKPLTIIGAGGLAFCH
jgi:hypothetical protein